MSAATREDVVVAVKKVFGTDDVFVNRLSSGSLRVVVDGEPVVDIAPNMLNVLGPEALIDNLILKRDQIRDAQKEREAEPESDLAELDRQRRALEVAIGYGPVSVSIPGHHDIRWVHRTTVDRDGLVTRILDAGFRVGAQS